MTSDRWLALALFLAAFVVVVHQVAHVRDWLFVPTRPVARDWLPMPLGLVQITPDDAILVTPRGVELDLRGSDLELRDVLEHVATIEAL